MSDLIYKPEKTRQDIELLLAEHKNLVYYCLTQKGQLQNQDAESAAWEALWDAIGTFSIYEKTAFSTYACRCIINAINDELRKSQTEYEHYNPCELTDDIPVPTAIEENLAYNRLRKTIDEVFKEHMESTRGLSRDILQLWRASGFEDNKTQIAKALNTSVSYVGRVQTAFKARLSGRLKDR